MSDDFDTTLEAVGARLKHLRLRRLARLWVIEHEARVSSLRVDVIGIEWQGENAVVDHRKRVIP